jgi:hypothetical protein
MSGDNMITIVAKTRSGAISPFQVLEIVSIDGKPYQPPGDVDALFQHINHLTGRIDTLERIVSASLRPEGK